MKMSVVLKFIFNQFMKEATETETAISHFFSRFIKLLVHWIHVKSKSYKLIADLNKAENFEEWEVHALKLDKLYGLNKWKADPRSELYDYKITQSLYMLLNQLRKHDLVKGLVFTLRSNLHKNICGIAHPGLYEKCHTGTKYIVEKFQNEIIKCLHYIYEDERMNLKDKLKFFSDIRHSYGRTALMFSGGASMGVYHLGCIKVLKELDLCPRIICGSSAGSMFAAVVATRTYEDLDLLYDPYYIEFNCFAYIEDDLTMKIARFLKDGVLFDINHFNKFLIKYIGEVTFLEAFEKTGWILNINVSSSHGNDVPRLLNYVTSPNVIIWSAVSASCAIPQVFEPVELLCKDSRGEIVSYTSTKSHKFIDGSVSADLPMQRISELFNVNTFIVSQVNPFVIPFISDDGGGILGTNTAFSRKLRSLINSEFFHAISLMSFLGLIPEKVERVAGIASQSYKGHVTISPKVRIGDYIHLLRNPTPEYVEDACRLSQHNTYPKIRLIRSIYEIEREIGNCYLGVLNSVSPENQVIRDINIDIVSPREKVERGSILALRQDNHKNGLKKSRTVSHDLASFDKAKQEKREKINTPTHKKPKQKSVKGHKLGSRRHSVLSFDTSNSLISDLIEEVDELEEQKDEVYERAAMWKSNTSQFQGS